MLTVTVFLCWLVAILHSLFRTPEATVWVPWVFLFPLVLAAPRVLYRKSEKLRQRVTVGWVGAMERVGLAAVLINIPGVLFFHVLYPTFQYDRFLHVSGAFTALWWQALIILPMRHRFPRRKLLIGLGIVMAVCLFAWEGYQWTQDQLFGSHTFFDYAQPIRVDFWEDIAFGALGLTIGLLSLNASFARYTSLRRMK